MIIGIRSDAININGAYDFNDPERIAIRNKMSAHLSLINDDCAVCICRASIGFEIDFMSACHDNEIPYIIYFPFEKINDRWPPQIQKVYKDILSKAKSKFVKNKGGYSPKKIKTTQDFVEMESDILLIVNRSAENVNNIQVKMLKFEHDNRTVRV
jgi:uncharacterized phage-like protein YoqJ